MNIFLECLDPNLFTNLVLVSVSSVPENASLIPLFAICSVIVPDIIYVMSRLRSSVPFTKFCDT